MRPAIGGVVKTYGGASRNYFHGGVLIGDAGSFVDPMTGEGITPAFESALLAAPVLMRALEAGHFGRPQLSEFEASFRRYFDPAMDFLDLCAATLRNHYMARPWLRALARGCELAQTDAEFALIGGSYFGGLDIRPSGILGQIWVRIAQEPGPRVAEVGHPASGPEAAADRGEPRRSCRVAGGLVAVCAARSPVARPLDHGRATQVGQSSGLYEPGDDRPTGGGAPRCLVLHAGCPGALTFWRRDLLELAVELVHRKRGELDDVAQVLAGEVGQAAADVARRAPVAVDPGEFFPDRASVLVGGRDPAGPERRGCGDRREFCAGHLHDDLPYTIALLSVSWYGITLLSVRSHAITSPLAKS